MLEEHDSVHKRDKTNSEQKNKQTDKKRQNKFHCQLQLVQVNAVNDVFFVVGLFEVMQRHVADKLDIMLGAKKARGVVSDCHIN